MSFRESVTKVAAGRALIMLLVYFFGSIDQDVGSPIHLSAVKPLSRDRDNT